MSFTRWVYTVTLMLRKVGEGGLLVWLLCKKPKT